MQDITKSELQQTTIGPIDRNLEKYFVQADFQNPSILIMVGSVEMDTLGSGNDQEW